MALHKKNITKVLLLIAVLYLLYTFAFFGSLNKSEKKESKSNDAKRDNVAPTIPLPPQPKDFGESDIGESNLDVSNSLKNRRADRKPGGLNEADFAPRPVINEPPQHPAVTAPPRTTTPPPLYQPIDINDEHKKRRLEILAEIYQVPRVDDSVYKLNETLSRTIDLDRPSSDLRPLKCQDLKYDLDSLPSISVIFPIYNEALSLILRTVHSVINHTPAKLLREIILVDDDAKYPNLKEPLDKYIKLLPDKVVILRNPQREGLIRARMRGAKLATGDVLLFQDSHTEFGPGWVEPALEYIKRHPNTIVQPTVQELNSQRIDWPKREHITFGDMWRGVFMWDMRYAWNLAPKSYTSWKLQDYDPFPNPVLVGCSIIVQKEFFYKIGGFDEGLNVWGGENIELSLRTWMCGGQIVIHPCSQIAHVFKPFSYGFDGDKEKIVAHNSMRVVETWMDEHRPYFYGSNFVYEFKRTELEEAEKESLRKHIQLREKLQCKSFDWYLKNVLPEMNIPQMDMTLFGEIQNTGSTLCWKVADDGYIVMTRDCYTYSRMKPESEFGLTKDGRLMYQHRCVSTDHTFLLRAVVCGQKGYIDTEWSFDVTPEQGMVIGLLRFNHQARNTKYCVQQITNVIDIHKNAQMPQLAACSESSDWQIWGFSYNFAFEFVPPKPV